MALGTERGDAWGLEDRRRTHWPEPVPRGPPNSFRGAPGPRARSAVVRSKMRARGGARAGGRVIGVVTAYGP